MFTQIHAIIYIAPPFWFNLIYPHPTNTFIPTYSFLFFFVAILFFGLLQAFCNSTEISTSHEKKKNTKLSWKIYYIF